MQRLPNKGFSFVETLVVVAISTVVMAAIVTSVLYFYSSNSNILEQALQINSARRGVEVLVRDVREATYSEEGAFPIAAIGSTTFTFYADFDRDYDVEKVRYYLDANANFIKATTEPSGNPLGYTSTEAASTIGEYIRNVDQGVAIFRYYNKDGYEITDYSSTTAVVFVSVNLVVNVNPTRLPGEFTLRSSATIRNLKTNL